MSKSPSANSVCAILKVYPEYYHLSPSSLIPWARPSLSVTWNMAMVFLPHGIPVAVLTFSKNISPITSLLCSNPPMSSHFTQNYIPILCSNDTPYQWGLPEMLHTIPLIPHLTPLTHAYTHTALRSCNSLAPLSFLVIDYIHFVFNNWQLVVLFCSLYFVPVPCRTACCNGGTRLRCSWYRHWINLVHKLCLWFNSDSITL